MQTRCFVTGAAAALLVAMAAPAVAQQMIAPNATVSGSLDRRDPVSSTGGRFDRWRIDAAAGELIVLRMDSGVIDPLIQIGRTGPGGEFFELATDDDGAGYPNALLQFRAAEGGTYEVRATSYGPESYGGYSLSRSSQAVNSGDGGGVNPIPLDVGGYIDLDDPADVDGRHFEAWRIRLTNQQVIRIRQESDSLDSWVMLGLVAADGAWIGLFHDDDSGGGLNSDFVYQSVADEVFEVRASTYAPGVAGPYRLIVEDVSATSDGGLRPGTITGGWLSDADNNTAGTYTEYRSFYAVAGQTITATLRSSEFDAYLRIGEWSDGAFHEMWSDDDSGGGDTGFDAQSTFVAPFTGLYTAALTSFGEGETGLFSFEVLAD
ncbi:MAG: hypothetical protein J0L52_11085 [Caulobacterales bacterium]|nr:hypothetical protein [Caulobacterales bacterium]